MADDPPDKFHQGLLRRELFLGLVCGVDARQARVNLSKAEEPTGAHFESARYGRGEVGELVLVEGQQDIILGRLTAVQVPDSDRKAIGNHAFKSATLDATGSIQFLGTVRTDNLQVSAGVAHYPRLGDRVYAAPHPFVGEIPILMNQDGAEQPITLHVGSVSGSSAAPVQLRPEKLFGRHCAVLGTTGGGKSWTVARLLGEASRFDARVVLLDATGEYRSLPEESTYHIHMDNGLSTGMPSLAAMPSTAFHESDFVALFDPSGKAQGPKLRAAMRSLKLAALAPHLARAGYIPKHDQLKGPVVAAENDPAIAPYLDNPRQPFDVTKLCLQIEQECVWPDAFGAARGSKDPTRWGGESGELSYCLALLARINAVLSSPAYYCVFQSKAAPATQWIDWGLTQDRPITRLSLETLSSEFGAREIIVNALGRHLLSEARRGMFRQRPVVVALDEAHNFLGRSFGSEDGTTRLDSFELIAREGRKYGLNLCLATQRPRDLTEGVLSQIGTLIVHRLTNDRDREIVERACGEIDRSATAFLANLRQGEAAIIGVDFPIPLTIQVGRPAATPLSDGPNYQVAWAGKAAT